MIKYLLLCASICFFLSCVKSEYTHGYSYDSTMVSKLHDTIKVGKSDRHDVMSLLGSPSTKGSFGNEAWYYINITTQKQAFWAPKVINQSVIVVWFDKAGKVASIKQYSYDDAKHVQYTKDETPTEGNSLGVVEQLLGNVGRFNPEGTATK